MFSVIPFLFPHFLFKIKGSTVVSQEGVKADTAPGGLLLSKWQFSFQFSQ